MENKINEALFEYALRIGDTSLILGQRLSEWCGHGPALEEDIAMSNMALDLIGQARLILSYAGKIEGKGRSEDDLAYHRDERQYRNLLLAEQPNGDFAKTMARHYLLSRYMLHLYDELKKSKDEFLRAFAEKSWKEIAYHSRHSQDWMLRLGDGTKESHERLQTAVNEIWPYTDDLFNADQTDLILETEGVGASLNIIKEKWEHEVDDLFKAIHITKPAVTGFMKRSSREGKHTEHLGFILAEMQFLPRAYPDATW